MVTASGGGYLMPRSQFHLWQGVDALDCPYLLKAKDRQGDAESFFSAGHIKYGVTSP